MTTTIHSNGGGNAQPIEALFARLTSDPLDRTFEHYGDFVLEPVDMKGRPMGEAGSVLFWGNFLTYSHVFSVITNDADLIERLTAAIRANQQRSDYLAQPPFFDVSKLEVRPVRFSTTQGEVKLIYAGEHLGQWGDDYTLNGRGEWVGRPFNFWRDFARKLMADRHAESLKEAA
jgi:hypothetical protein